MENELTELATHVLPVTGQLERDDISMYSPISSVRPTMQSTAAVVAPVAERRPAWWVLGNLAARLGRDLLGGADPDALTDELYLRGIVDHSPLDADTVFAAGSRGLRAADRVRLGARVDAPRRPVAPRPRGAARTARPRTGNPRPGLVLSPGRAMAWSNSVRYGPDGTDLARASRLPTPADAADAGVGDGDAAPRRQRARRRRRDHRRRRSHPGRRRDAGARPPRPQPRPPVERPRRGRPAHDDAAHVRRPRPGRGEIGTSLTCARWTTRPTPARRGHARSGPARRARSRTARSATCRRRRRAVRPGRRDVRLLGGPAR